MIVDSPMSRAHTVMSPLATMSTPLLNVTSLATTRRSRAVPSSEMPPVKVTESFVRVPVMAETNAFAFAIESDSPPSSTGRSPKIQSPAEKAPSTLSTVMVSDALAPMTMSAVVGFANWMAVPLRTTSIVIAPPPTTRRTSIVSLLEVPRTVTNGIAWVETVSIDAYCVPTACRCSSRCRARPARRACRPCPRRAATRCR
jgi:hypothetical protein